jgi:hypothetical protein
MGNKASPAVRVTFDEVHGLETRAQHRLRSLPNVPVILVRWPLEMERRSALAAHSQPRLLLVEQGAEPPSPADCLEDWVLLPADEAELRARIDGLEARRRCHGPSSPSVDDDGILHFGQGWLALPPVEARLARALADRFEAVVSREAMTRAGWPHGVSGRNALDVHVLRLRRRIEELGLSIRTVRGRGYVLDTSRTFSSSAPEVAADA